MEPCQISSQGVQFRVSCLWWTLVSAHQNNEKRHRGLCFLGYETRTSFHFSDATFISPSHTWEANICFPFHKSLRWPLVAWFLIWHLEKFALGQDTHYSAVLQQGGTLRVPVLKNLHAPQQQLLPVAPLLSSGLKVTLSIARGLTHTDIKTVSKWITLKATYKQAFCNPS